MFLMSYRLRGASATGVGVALAFYLDALRAASAPSLHHLVQVICKHLEMNRCLINYFPFFLSLVFFFLIVC